MIRDSCYEGPHSTVWRICSNDPLVLVLKLTSNDLFQFAKRLLDIKKFYSYVLFWKKSMYEKFVVLIDHDNDIILFGWLSTQQGTEVAGRFRSTTQPGSPYRITLDTVFRNLHNTQFLPLKAACRPSVMLYVLFSLDACKAACVGANKLHAN